MALLDAGGDTAPSRDEEATENQAAAAEVSMASSGEDCSSVFCQQDFDDASECSSAVIYLEKVDRRDASGRHCCSATSVSSISMLSDDSDLDSDEEEEDSKPAAKSEGGGKKKGGKKGGKK